MNKRVYIIAFGLSLWTAACITYDPPPDASLAVPEKGTYEVGDPLLISFSEAIDKASLVVRVWSAGPEDITLEGDFVPGLKPAITACTVSSCEGAVLTLGDDKLSAELKLTAPAFDEAKVPWVLEIAEGLKDTAGRGTGTDYSFDFQFSPSSVGNGEPIEFESTVYHMLSAVEKPLPVILSLYLDMKVLENGDGRIVGAKVKAIDGAPKNSTNPDELILDTSDNGFVLFGTGKMTVDNGNRFFATEPSDLKLTFGPIKLTLAKLRINTAVEKHPETGKDRLEGTITFAKAILDSGGDSPAEFEASVNNFFADQVPLEYVTEEFPRVCGNLCGSVPKQCDPPSGFPGDEICSDE